MWIKIREEIQITKYMETLIPINVLIGDRTYRVKVDPKDEEAVRRTLKQINEKVIEFKTQFAGKDMQDYIAMVILWFATQQSNNGSETQTADALVKLENLLDKTLTDKD